MHRYGHKSKDVFDTTTNFGFATVVFFLFFGQRLIAIAFFADFVLDMLVAQGAVLCVASSHKGTTFKYRDFVSPYRPTVVFISLYQEITDLSTRGMFHTATRISQACFICKTKKDEPRKARPIYFQPMFIENRIKNI